MKHLKCIILSLTVLLISLEPCLSVHAAENGYSYLLMPTQIKKIDNTYFIVDCNHDQVIYSDQLSTNLANWKVLTRNAKKPHAIASDGEIYMVVDTDNNRVLTFEKGFSTFKALQTFEHIGTRPHFVDYDNTNELFYVWSSMTGEMFLFKKIPGTKSVTLQEIKTIPELNNCYVRSFTISGDIILFPAVERSSILMVDKNTFEVLNEYPVPEYMAGMVQISIIDGYFLITISTDIQYNLQASTVVRAQCLEDFGNENYENLYSLFGNNGTPYFVSHFDGYYYMIHENATPNIYRFHAQNGNICDIKGMF